MPTPKKSALSSLSSSSSSSGGFLEGKLALITGGSGTIGKAIAKVLIAHGMEVILTARRMERLKQAQEALMKEFAFAKNKIHIISTDVSKEESVLALFKSIDSMKMNENNNEQQQQDEEKDGQKIKRRTGGRVVDLLVNNAGTMAPGPTTNLTVEEMQRVLSVNVVGPFLCAREAMKRMKQYHTGGRIINIGSIASSSPRPDSAAYTTSKFALQGLSQSLSLDGRNDNIAVGSIHPGNVVSDLLSSEEIAKREATEGFIRPEDVANCVLTMANLPYSANVLDLTVIPTKQPFVGRG